MKQFFRNILRKRENTRATAEMERHIARLQERLQRTNPRDRTRCRAICEQIRDMRTAILKVEMGRTDALRSVRAK